MNLKKATFIKTKKKIKTKVFDFCIDEVKWVNNKVMNRYLIKHNGITSIVPVIDKKNILLVRQYRYGADQIIWEVPAGTIDQNETPLKCAKRELKEETGYVGTNWKSLGNYFATPAYNSCRIFTYTVDCEQKFETNLDDDEVIDVKIFSKNEIRKLMNGNKLRDMKTYVAIDRYFKLLT